MKKIVHIIGDLSIGGTERALSSILIHFPNKEIKYYVISLSGNGYFSDEIKKAGIEVFGLNLKGILSLPKNIFKLIFIVHKIRPDILQGWMYHSNLVVSLLKYTFIRQPKIFWNIRQSLYSLQFEKKSTIIVINILKFLSRLPDKIIFNSEVAKNHHLDFGYNASKAAVIFNGFDTNFWKFDAIKRTSIRSLYNITENDLLLGYVGRYHSVKNLELLLEVIADLSPDYPDLKVMFIGKDLVRGNENVNKFLYSSTDNNIFLLGNETDIPGYLSAFDGFCLCSNSEAFPNVLAEAMSCNLYCMSTNVGDVPLILGDLGCIIPPNDKERLKKAIIFWIENHLSLKENGRRARERIKNNFPINKNVADYCSIYLS
jgi:glycosyltransferase involved in cell wall biosynthesis